MPEAPRPGEMPPVGLALGAYVKLLRASKTVLARVEARLARDGLTANQLGVLEAILHKGPLTQRELLRKVLTSPGNLTDVIDKLQARGLVTRCRPETDRRLVLVDLTAGGRCLIERVFPIHAHDIAEAMSGLEPHELEELGHLLRKLGTSAAQETPEPGLAAEPQRSHLGANRSISNEDRAKGDQR